MKLQNKILIALSMAWLLFLGLMYTGSNAYLLKTFLALEHARTQEDLYRIDHALDQINLSLAASTSDWPDKLELYTPSEIVLSPKLTHFFNITTIANNGHYDRAINENELEGYSVIKDVHNKPIGLLRMTAPRSIYLNGINTINYFLMTFIALGIAFSLLLLWLLRIFVIRRLERLDKEVADISKNKAIDPRVTVSGKDEISSLANAINHMLAIIHASQYQLEQRVEERTQELTRTNDYLQEEIKERKSIEQELIVHKEHLDKLAHYDSLTSLPNRVFFNELLNKAISHARRNNKTIALLFIDLDQFKKINDALGHSTGDEVLKEMSKRFSEILRDGDTLARLAGDEFIVLLNDIDHAKAAGHVAEKIISTCAAPVNIQSHEFFIRTSIGISIFPDDGDSLETLQKSADIAMYRAKRAGGGNYIYYSSDMDVTAHEHIKLEAALRKAIQHNEFVLHFQPQLSLNDATIKRAEALLRWEHPELGLISPMKFIPLAEETGLIMPIGEWALHEACRINKSWQDEGYDPITVSVNISPKQFQHQDVAKIVADALEKNQLNAKYLELEITETAVMDDVEAAIEKLSKIHAMGVKIAVDDFGTGYTSINYLKKFPISVLKIDQTFIKGIPHNQNDAAITSAVIAMGHNLGLEVVAEGVETADQMQYLAAHHCDLIQGYFLSSPVAANKMALQLLKSNITEDNRIESM